MPNRFAPVFLSHGDELFRVGQRSQSIEDVRSTLSAVEEALDALDRAFHPTLDSRVHREQVSHSGSVGLGNSITQDCETRSPDGDGLINAGSTERTSASVVNTHPTEQEYARAGSEPAESQSSLGNSITPRTA